MMSKAKLQEPTISVYLSQEPLDKTLLLLDESPANKKGKLVLRWFLDEKSKLRSQWVIE